KRPLKPNVLSEWVRRTRERLGLGPVIPYGYRHALATDALAAGGPDAQVAALLGHEGTAVLHRHYAHLTARLESLRSALGRARGDEPTPGEGSQPGPEEREQPRTGAA